MFAAINSRWLVLASWVKAAVNHIKGGQLIIFNLNCFGDTTQPVDGLCSLIEFTYLNTLFNDLKTN